MLKKDAEIKWTNQARNSFEDIKKSIMEAPTLISPDYTKGFYILSFSSYDTVATVLLQKKMMKVLTIQLIFSVEP